MDDFRRRPVQRPAGRPVQRASVPLSSPGKPVAQPAPQSVSPSVSPVPTQTPPTPVNTPTPPETTPAPTPSAPSPETELQGTPGIGALKPKRSRKKLLLWGGIGLLTLVLLIMGGIAAWFYSQLQPVDAAKTERQVHTVVAGSTPTMIAAELKEDGLIRNEQAFLWYAKFNGTENRLQAGTYRLSASESTPKIIEHLTKGSTDEFTITFLPGDTLAAHREVLEKAGYKTEEIDQAFAAAYDHPLLASKPANASLEGYIYGQTYQIASGSTVETILEKTFDQFYAELEEKELESALSSKGYSLHKAITLASIIQREEKNVDNQRKVAGVFLNRLEIDMPLQSDPTFIYAARQIGAPENNKVESPYNTYKYAGLPPGPIASPNVTALEAIVSPEPSDYLYFLSGDDDQLYFASTFEQHERNIQNHCQVKCFSY